MSYEESFARKRSNQYFRTSMDIGMGLFYTILGGMLLATKSFAAMAVPAWIAYLLGSMMLIGGVYRFYKGIRAIFPAKRQQPQDN